jgi:hypothetical protein
MKAKTDIITALLPHIPERQAFNVAKGIDALEAGIVAGEVKNVAFTDAKDAISRAVEDGAEKFLATGPHEQKHHQSDWWLGAYHADAFVSGWHDLPTKLKRAEKAGLAEYAAFLKTLMPLHALMAQAKPLIVKRRVLSEAERKAEIERQARLGGAMTCQCCGRAIHANLGTIAHHGYERPGDGWQTASCMGAKELPFEVSRDALGKMIVEMEAYGTRLVAQREEIKAEKQDIGFTYTDYSERVPYGRKRPTKTVMVNRANYKTHAEVLRKHTIHSFDALKNSKVEGLSRSIRAVIGQIAAEKKRYFGWTQTHKRFGKDWQKINEGGK